MKKYHFTKALQQSWLFLLYPIFALTLVYQIVLFKFNVFLCILLSVLFFSCLLTSLFFLSFRYIYIDSSKSIHLERAFQTSGKEKTKLILITQISEIEYKVDINKPYRFSYRYSYGGSKRTHFYFFINMIVTLIDDTKIVINLAGMTEKTIKRFETDIIKLNPSIILRLDFQTWNNTAKHNDYIGKHPLK